MAIIDVEREELKRGLDEGTILLIDIREPQEFAQGRIPGAVPYPLSGLDPDQLQALVREDGRRPVLSCLSGSRTARTLAHLQSLGIPLREHYGGGFKDWLSSGEAVER